MTAPMGSITVTAADELPKYVKTADGGYFEIPQTGNPGSFAFARQAALVRNAYAAAGQTAQAAKWNQEYQRRVEIWQRIEKGQDRAMVLAQFGKDLITAPVRILADVGNTVLDAGKKAADTVFTWARWLPWLLLAGLVVIGVGLQKGSLRLKV